MSVGLLFVLVQGELVDLYLNGGKVFIVIISGAKYIADVASTTAGTALYVAGGWTYVGPGIALLSLIPLLAVPWVIQVQRKVSRACQTQSGLPSREAITQSRAGSAREEDKKPEDEGPKLSLLRQITFYMPDVAVFLNNIAHASVVFVLPVS